MVVSLLILTLSAWSLAPAGIIELGRKGQIATGSTFRVFVEGQPFDPNHHMAGDTVESIVLQIVAKIDAHPSYAAAIPDLTNNPTVFTVTRLVNMIPTEPTRLEVFIDDRGIGGAFVQFGKNGGHNVTLHGAAFDPDPNIVQADPNANFEVDFTFAGGGSPISHVISTFGRSDTAVNADLLADLVADGFNVHSLPNGSANEPQWMITSQGAAAFDRIEVKRTDVRSRISGVGHAQGGGPAIPTLSEWGILLLAALLGLTGISVLVRRRSSRNLPE